MLLPLFHDCADSTATTTLRHRSSDFAFSPFSKHLVTNTPHLSIQHRSRFPTVKFAEMRKLTDIGFVGGKQRRDNWWSEFGTVVGAGRMANKEEHVEGVSNVLRSVVAD